MSIANLLEDENVLNIKGLFKLKQMFIIKIVERLIVASKSTIQFGVVFLLTLTSFKCKFISTFCSKVMCAWNFDVQIAS
jgi:hypothetical protein